MTTVSDAFVETRVAAVAGGSQQSPPDSPVPARTRDARARVAVTARVGKRLASDVTGAWVWTASPPSLADLAAARRPTTDRVPSGSGLLHTAWVVWNYTVALPGTAVLYVCAWVLQHPARGTLAAAVAGTVIAMWTIK